MRHTLEHCHASQLRCVKAWSKCWPMTWCLFLTAAEINALAEPLYGRDKVVRLITNQYEAYRSVTSTSLQVLNGQPAVMVWRSEFKPGHASFYTMHCELDETLHLRRLHLFFAPSKLMALKPALLIQHLQNEDALC